MKPFFRRMAVRAYFVGIVPLSFVAALLAAPWAVLTSSGSYGYTPWEQLKEYIKDYFEPEFWSELWLHIRAGSFHV